MTVGFKKTPREIPRIEPPEAEAFERSCRRPRRPVVLRGLLANTELDQWSFESLRSEFEKVEVPMHRTCSGAVTPDPRLGVPTEPHALGELLDQLGGGGAPSLYMMSRVEELPAQWGGRVTTPLYCEKAGWLSRKLWISPSGTATMLHRDAADNIHLQLIGSKRFTLIEPSQSARLYPNSLFDSVPNGCRADLDAPDFERYPDFRDVEMEVTELEPGDAVYIPRGSWHHVRTVADSLSANFWWAVGWRLPLVFGADLFKRLRGVSR